MREYRVKWRREDNSRNLTRIYQTEAPTRRLALIVQGRFAEAFPGTDPDGYACCDGQPGGFGDGPCSCKGQTNAEVWREYHDRFPPLVFGPVVESREVGEWEAADA